MDKQKFLEQCEKAKPGSAAKLERIIEVGDAGKVFYEEPILEDEPDAGSVLLRLFLWRLDDEGDEYWRDLYLKLGSEPFC